MQDTVFIVFYAAVPAGALGLIAAERRRQVEAEGWTPEHDDGHRGELAVAAARYAVLHTDAQVHDPEDSALDWIKPKDTIRNLVRAGALIVAEIERLQRAAGDSQPQEGSRP